MIASRAPARTRWQMDFWTRSHPLETNSTDAALAVSLSVAEFDRWRGAIMRGKFAPRGPRVAPFGFSRDIRCTYHGIRSWRLRREIDGTRENARVLLPLFFSPSYLAYSARRIGRTIYFRCVKTSDWWRHDANSTMWELIVTGSHRRGIIIKTAYE